MGAGIMGMGVVYAILILSQQGLLPDGVYDLVTMQGWPPWLRMVVALLLGGFIVLIAIMRLGRNLVEPFRHPHEDIATSLYDYSQRKRGPRIVAIGGGTGMPTFLRGLREYTNNITAIVTVADDGGSSSRIRRELGVLPPGDFRNNIAALAGDETLMTQLMQYRFGGRPGSEESSQLQGHAFGNLLLVALTGITGSFEEALLAMDRVLRMRGRVLPSTLDNVTLAADVWVGDPPVREAHHWGISHSARAAAASTRLSATRTGAGLSCGPASHSPGGPHRHGARQPVHQHFAQPARARPDRSPAPQPRSKVICLQPCHTARRNG
ncbi:MAG: YvcK family protein [Chloroflexi bacterium]|nr:YvcK family protein [Chloroflexota bacterium]